MTGVASLTLGRLEPFKGATITREEARLPSFIPDSLRSSAPFDYRDELTIFQLMLLSAKINYFLISGQFTRIFGDWN